MGTFGSVLAEYLSLKGHQILPEQTKDAEMIFVVVPSDVVLDVLLKEKENIVNQKIIICSKGFYKNSILISESLEDNFQNIFYLYGPTLAQEIKEGKLSAFVLAGGIGKEEIKKEVESSQVHIELSDDVIGVQVGASLKNVMAIFLGIIEGQNYGENTKAYAFTKCVKEIKNFGLKLGAKEETFLGLSCVGDLTLFSRNRLFGVEIGKERKMETILKELDFTPQGIENTKYAREIAKREGIPIPIIDSLYSILFKNASPQETMRAL